MSEKLRIALLPLFVELYDQTLPEARAGCEKILGEVIPAFAALGIDTVKLSTCRTRPEFEEAISSAETSDVDALVTLHLAYSPSLESIEPLARTPLPIIVLDTTTDYSFSPHVDSAILMYNHGIHGVQDMCNLLVRRGKRFDIVAGHWRESAVINRAATCIKAAALAKACRSVKAGRIGDPFEGMGDFDVPMSVIEERIGITTVTAFARHIAALMPGDDDGEVEREMVLDKERYNASAATDVLHRKSVRAGLAVRRWLETEEINAYALNFLGLTADSGFEVIPFLEAQKAMSRGVGYAGEGDILTASLVSALATQYQTTFTEMFCPDWKDNRIFLSHMGEVNPDILDGTPVLIDKHWDFCPLSDSCILVGVMKPGAGVFIDIAPIAEDRFRLIAVPAAIEEVDGEGFSDSIRAWMKPGIDIAEFLERYSQVGGTHHAAFSYSADATEIAAFASYMDWESIIIS